MYRIAHLLLRSLICMQNRRLSCDNISKIIVQKARHVVTGIPPQAWSSANSTLNMPANPTIVIIATNGPRLKRSKSLGVVFRLVSFSPPIGTRSWLKPLPQMCSQPGGFVISGRIKSNLPRKIMMLRICRAVHRQAPINIAALCEFVARKRSGNHDAGVFRV